MDELNAWLSKTIPLVYRNEITILEFILKFLYRLQSSIEVNIDYQTIVDNLKTNQYFYAQFATEINKILEDLGLGSGNINSRYYNAFSGTQPFTVNILPTGRIPAYLTDGTTIAEGINFEGIYTRYGMLTTLAINFYVNTSLVGTFDDATNYIYALYQTYTATEAIIADRVSYGGVGTPKAFYMPYGSSDKQITVRPARAVASAGTKSLFTFATTGAVLNNLAPVPEEEDVSMVSFIAEWIGAWSSTGNNDYLSNIGGWQISSIVGGE